MKKASLFVLALAGAALASCGNSQPTSQSASNSSSGQASVSSSSSSAPSSSSVTSEDVVEQTFEILGSQDELYSMYGAFEFYGTMSSDGTGSLVMATVSSSGDNANKAILDDAISFKYKIEEDEDIFTLTAAIAGTRYTAYKAADDTYKIDYQFTFAGTYSRHVDLIVSPTIRYADVNEWVEDVEEDYASRVTEVTLDRTLAGPVVYADTKEPFKINFGAYGEFAATAKFELYSDNSVIASYGVGGANGGAEFEGTWSYTNDANFKITINGSDFVTVTENEVVSCVWSFNHEVKDAEGNVLSTIALEATLTQVAEEAE